MFDQEIAGSRALRIIYWVLLAGFTPAFFLWSRSEAITIKAAQAGRHVCLPYFQNCGDYYFLRGLPPHALDQLLLFGILFGFLAASGFMAWRNEWRLSLRLLLVPFVFKILYLTVFTYQTQADFEYFHIPPLAVLLFSRNKLQRIRVVVAVTYFLSAFPKFTPAWLDGSYFTALEGGMPLIADGLIPYATKATIIFELVAPWFLLCRDRRLRFSALSMWTAFHLYSFLLVGWRFPVQCLPLLWATFATGEWRPFHWRLLTPAHGALILYIALGAAPTLLFSERAYTLRWQKIGLSMMDANRQCVVEKSVEFGDGSTRTNTIPMTASWRRCEAYRAWFLLRQSCSRPGVHAVRLNLDLSINGEPYYRIVDNVNVCEVEYRVFAENSWIKTPSRGARVTGNPKKNRYD